MQARGVKLRLYSLWGGGGDVPRTEGPGPAALVVLRGAALVDPVRVGAVSRRCCGSSSSTRCGRRAPSALNFWENMLGAGFTACFVHRFRRDPPDLVYAAWTGGPATAAWLLWRLTGIPYGTGAHAYDLYEHGGDWWLMEKVALARFVHTSTEMGRRTLLERGADAAKVDRHPPRTRRLSRIEAAAQPRAGRCGWSAWRGWCRRKGCRHSSESTRRCARRGWSFRGAHRGRWRTARRAGARDRALGLARQVAFTGEVPPAEVWEHLRWADVLLHTGVVAATGDRDGLPNVIPEAMAAGTLVVTSASPRPWRRSSPAVNLQHIEVLLPVRNFMLSS